MTRFNFWAIFPAILATTTLLPACSSVQSTARSTAKTTATAATSVHGAIVREDAPASLDRVGRADNLGDALMTPARDLNIRREQMPEELARIEDPYARPGNGCDMIHLELAELDYALGPDYDEPKPAGKTKRKGFNLMASAVGSVIPYRSLVREVTGAKSKERKLREAYRKGTARRGYLRGVARERGCPL